MNATALINSMLVTVDTIASTYKASTTTVYLCPSKYRSELKAILTYPEHIHELFLAMYIQYLSARVNGYTEEERKTPEAELDALVFMYLCSAAMPLKNQTVSRAAAMKRLMGN